MLRISLFTVLVFLVTSVCAQQTPSEEHIEKGKQLYDEGQYDQAIQQYRMVMENDSNYSAMMAELAMTYLAKGSYDSAIYIANQGLAVKGADKMHLLRTKGTAYDSMGETDKAIKTYKMAIEKYPYTSLLYFNLGITYYNNGLYKEAQACFEQSATGNPYHASSHRMLALLAARQKMYTRALLSLETFLALEPASSRSNPMLVYLENISGNYLDTSMGDFIEPFIDNTIFEEVDHYFKAKLVLNSRYPAIIDFRADLVKQTQMLVEVLPFDKFGDDFWVKMYFPFFNAVKQGNYLEPLLYTLLTSTGSESVKEYQSKNEKTLKAFYQTGSNLSYIKQQRTANLDGEMKLYQCRYFDDGQLYSIGNKNDQDAEIGPWEYFFRNGALQAKGRYLNGSKDGDWVYYDEDGNLKSTESYSNAMLTSDYIDYYDNGNKRLVAPYINNKAQGTVRWYDYFGRIESQVEFKDNQRQGKGLTYFINGRVRESYNYEAGELTGVNVRYFSTGDTAFVYRYEAGELQGPGRSYFMNGQKEAFGNFKDGYREGEWFEYYSNGKLKSQANYTGGEITGKYTTYYHNGTLESVRLYNAEGKAEGSSLYYNRNGQLYVEEVYANGILVKVSSFDKNGKPYAISESAEGTFDFTTYDTDGKKMNEGSYVQGTPTGQWNSYYKNGQVMQTVSYSEGKLDGEVKRYYPSGQLSALMYYQAGQLEGSFTHYEKNGNVKTEGYYKNGQQDNLWRYYNSKGELDTENYYLDGQLTGYNYDYSVTGHLASKRKNHHGRVLSYIEFNEQGDTTNYTDLQTDSLMVFCGTGKLQNCEITTLAGLNHGPLTWYHPDGKLSSRKMMDNDLAEGHYERYYENGQLAVTGNFLNGDQTGKWTYYYESGAKENDYFFFEDEKDSVCYSYHENGQLEEKESYFNGELQGDCYQYDDNGELMIKLIYANNELMGYQYNKNGQLCDTIPVTGGQFKVEAFFNNGQKSYELNLLNFAKQGQLKKYDSKGQLRRLRNYENDLLTGACQDYYANGQLKEEFHFADGLKDGEETQYFENGKLKKQISWKSDEEHGPTKYFDATGKLIKEVEYSDGLFIAVKN